MEIKRHAHRGISIRTAVIGLLLSHLIGAVGVTGWLWYRNGQEAVVSIEHELVRELASRVRQKIETFAAVPHRVNQINSDALRRGEIDLKNTDGLVHRFFDLMTTYTSITYVYLATHVGEYVGLERLVNGPYRAWHSVKGDSRAYAVTSDGHLGVELQREDYDPRKRAWYKQAVVSKGPTWTDVYVSYSDPVRLNFTALHPWRDADGVLRVVFAVDVVLRHVDRFLRSMEIGRTGRVFLLDRQGRLVGNSSDHPSVRSDRKQPRIDGAKSNDALIAGTTKSLRSAFGDLGSIRTDAAKRIELHGETVLVRVAPISDGLGMDWLVVVAVPERDFREAIDAGTRTTAWIFLGILVVAGLSGALVANGLVRPILRVRGELERAANFELDRDAVTARSWLSEINGIQRSLETMKSGLYSFSRYVPAPLVRRLIQLNREAVLGMEPVEVTVSFTDLAGFTAMSESLSPEQLVEVVGDYFDLSTQMIHDTNGTVDKFIGDAVMAFWNAPEPVPDHAQRACETALACQQRIAASNEELQKRGLPPLTIRTGIHVGPVLVGNLGSHTRMNYTVIGDTVNLAARLEGINKRFGTQIAVSDAVWSSLADRFVGRPLGRVRVKGRKSATLVWELIALADDASEELQEKVRLHTRAFERFELRDYKGAADDLEKILETDPDDPAARYLFEAAKKYEAAPPPLSWDGVDVLDSK